MKLRTIIVDDEPLGLDLLKRLLSEFAEVELVECCSNGREAIAATQALRPDLLILDIQMPGLNGFDVVKRLQADEMPMVIFCTAYQQYAVEAFDLHAVDYLLKPIDRSRLDRAVRRAVARSAQESTTGPKSALIGAIGDITAKVESRPQSSMVPEEHLIELPEKIAIKDRDRTVLVDVEEIEWVDAAGDYMCIHAGGETHILRSTLKQLMLKLDEALFKRIHRSTLVNIKYIIEVEPKTKGEYILHLNAGQQLKVSRNYREGITEYLAGL